jgi:hypothetical protein
MVEKGLRWESEGRQMIGTDEGGDPGGELYREHSAEMREVERKSQGEIGQRRRWEKGGGKRGKRVGESRVVKLFGEY